MIVKTNEVAGKNLIHPDKRTITHNGITFTVNDDYSITINGTSTETAEIKFDIHNNLRYQRKIFEVGKTYTISVKSKPNSLDFYFVCGSGPFSYAELNTSNTPYTFTAQESSNNTYAILRVIRNKTFNNVRVYIQLEEGSNATPYEPFKGYKSYLTADSDKLMEEMN